MVAGGLVLNGSFKIEDPSKEDLDKVLDLVKGAYRVDPEVKVKSVTTIAIPLYSVSTGKKNDFTK